MPGLACNRQRAILRSSLTFRILILTFAVVFASMSTGRAFAAEEEHQSPHDVHKAMRDQRAMGPDPFDRDEALETSQAAVGAELSNLRFTRSDGEEISLSDYQGQPLLVNMIYTSCVHTCPLIVESLERSVKIARNAMGDESFKVITVGFDTRLDTPKQMKAYAHTRGIRTSGWDFLSADEETVAQLSKELGFLFVAAPHGFDHLAQLSIVDGEGVVYRQVYGVQPPPPSVVEPLKDLIFGRKSGFTSFDGIKNQVRLFCTIYNPASGKYQFDYSLIVGMVIGFLSLVAIGTFLIRGFIGLRKSQS